MKKLIIVLVLLLAATALFGQSIKIGAFPEGKWIDSPKGGEYDYEAVWEFSANGIRILNTDGSVAWDFAGKTINDFNVSTEGRTFGLSFSCPEAERSYSFKTTTSTDLVMVIKRSGLDDYTVTMKAK